MKIDTWTPGLFLKLYPPASEWSEEINDLIFEIGEQNKLAIPYSGVLKPFTVFDIDSDTINYRITINADDKGIFFLNKFKTNKLIGIDCTSLNKICIHIYERNYAKIRTYAGPTLVWNGWYSYESHELLAIKSKLIENKIIENTNV